MPLVEAKRVVKKPSRTTLNVLGLLRADISHKKIRISADVYVLKELDEPLLSRSHSVELGLVQRLSAVVDTQPGTVDPKGEFPQLFQGLGCVKQPYKVKLRKDAVPLSLSTPLRIPIPLMEKIKEELDSMITLGVIESVDEPTDWCSAMVVVTKSNRSYRICVDFTELNKYVERERHPLPVTDHVLGQLGNAKFFSKLDANFGFCQFELAQESQILTTFITPFGRVKFKQLPFGITSAPEFFQKKMSQLLS